MSLLKRLFGLFSGPDRKPDPPSASSVVAAPPAPPPVRTPRIFLGWSELIDAHASIAGYLLVPSALTPSGEITADNLLAALREENIERFASQRPLIVPMSASQWRTANFAPLIGRHSFFLITDLTELPLAEQQALSLDIRSAGARLAINHRAEMSARHLPPIDLLIFNFHSEPLVGVEQTLLQLRQQNPRLLLVADEVRSWAEHRLCRSLGFDYCLGSFATTPDDEAQPGQISESRMVVIDMLNQLRSDNELGELAHTAMRDPAVVIKLLDMANSPVYGLTRKVANLEEAIMLIGRDALYRWLSIAFFHLDAGGGRDHTLLVLSLCRARLLEGLLRDSDRQRADELFLVGLLSVVDSLLGQPMADILSRIRLPDDVAAALIRNEGPYARYLQLALSMERCRLDHAVILAASMQISPSQLVDSYRDALAWASTALLAGESE